MEVRAGVEVRASVAVGGRGGRGEGDPHLHPSAMKISPENRFEATLRSFCCCSFLCATGQVPGGVSVTTHGSTDLQRFVVHNDAKMSD